MKIKIDDYLAGKKLLGDDFNQKQINEWYAEEEEAYADLGASDRNSYIYTYHELNKFNGFRFLKNQHFTRALGMGSAYGDEFIPIVDQIKHITILDPSNAFSKNEKISETPCVYVKPQRSGTLDFDSNHFDLITSFGVLHHIPNVSYILSECYRVLKPGGVMLVREPITSMGDWRFPRVGLTKRERGIAVGIFDKVIAEAKFKVVRKSLCEFSPLTNISAKMGITIFNYAFFSRFDAILCRLFSWNLKYHRKSFIDKVAPGSVFYLLSK